MITEITLNQSSNTENPITMSLFRPPICRNAGTVLDRSLFSKIVPLSAARVTDKKLISKCRQSLEKSKDLLRAERLGAVRPDPDTTLAAHGGKCLLLRPDIKADGEFIFLWSLLTVLMSRSRAFDMEQGDYSRSRGGGL